MPVRVIEPVVEEFGSSPVEPALNDVTAVAGATQEAVVPLEVRTAPLLPIPMRVAVLTPLPMIRSPTLVIGESALKAALAVVCPVPPLARGMTVVAVTLVPLLVKN